MPVPWPVRKPLYVQVIVDLVLAVILGHLDPDLTVAMAQLGDAFIRLITMVIGFVVFCTVVSGISGMKDMKDMKEVGRIGGKALVSFEVVSTLALPIGVVVGNVLQPGAGFNADPAKLDPKAIATYAGRAQGQSVSGFLSNVIPNTVVDAFARGDILPIVLVSVLVGYATSALGERAKPVQDVIDAGGRVVFGVIDLPMRLAPIGAIAFTVGKYGVSSPGPLFKPVATFYLTSVLFVVVVSGAVGLWAQFDILKLLRYIEEEILIVFGTSSSDPALPLPMEKLEWAGCSKPVVGLVVPTGHVFNTDGTSISMTLAALFVAQATNTNLTWTRQFALFAVAVLTSKGASGVTGAGFIALAATLSVVPSTPLAGMGLIRGIDRFMSEARALVNRIGNAVATIVMAHMEGGLDHARLKLALDGGSSGDPGVGEVPDERLVAARR